MTADRLLTSKEAAQYITDNCTTCTDYMMRASRVRGKLLGKKNPAYIKYGEHVGVRYKKSTLDSWINDYMDQPEIANTGESFLAQA